MNRRPANECAINSAGCRERPIVGEYMRLRKLLVPASLACLLGCATQQSPSGKADTSYAMRMSARLEQYSRQDTEVEAAMKDDAQRGALTQLLKDIFKDAELHARSAILSRYIREEEGGVKPSTPGSWLLNRVTDLQRSTQETDIKAALLKPSLTSSPASETTVKQLVDLTGHRGWDKGTAEELTAIADDIAGSKTSLSGTVDEQKRSEAARQLGAYQAARAGSESSANPPSAFNCGKMSLDGGCATP